MQRCIELALSGLGKTSPNPMVGCVIVQEDKIIAEGYHQEYGKAHAEVNAIEKVQNKKLLKKSTLYVSLEPCSHFGKTAPCADLISRYRIPEVVVGTLDPNPLVSGKGLEKLRQAGIKVTVPVLEKECRFLNRRFFTFHEKKRPYIILKWAQSRDGFIDGLRSDTRAGSQIKISGDKALYQAQLWRSQEQAIIVGTNTALQDNPRLNVRLVKGRDPLRVVIDRNLSIPSTFHLMDNSVPTLIFTEKKALPIRKNTEFIHVSSNSEAARDTEILPFILKSLYQKNIQSLIVEGGAKLLSSFLQQNLWDETRIITSEKELHKGIKSPEFDTAKPDSVSTLGTDSIGLYFNKNSGR